MFKISTVLTAGALSILFLVSVNATGNYWIAFGLSLLCLALLAAASWLDREYDL